MYMDYFSMWLMIYFVHCTASQIAGTRAVCQMRPCVCSPVMSKLSFWIPVTPLWLPLSLSLSLFFFLFLCHCVSLLWCPSLPLTELCPSGLSVVCFSLSLSLSFSFSFSFSLSLSLSLSLSTFWYLCASTLAQYIVWHTNAPAPACAVGHMATMQCYTLWAEKRSHPADDCLFLCDGAIIGRSLNASRAPPSGIPPLELSTHNHILHPEKKKSQIW